MSHQTQTHGSEHSQGQVTKVGHGSITVAASFCPPYAKGVIPVLQVLARSVHMIWFCSTTTDKLLMSPLAIPCCVLTTRSGADSLGGLGVDPAGDVHGLLRGVRVAAALVHLEVREQVVADAPAGQHAPDGLLHYALRDPLFSPNSSNVS